MKSPNGTSNTGGVQNIGNFSATVCKTVRAVCYRTVVCPLLFVSLSVTLVYCGQTVGWIKMPLGSEVELGPGHIVLDGDPTPPHTKGNSSLQFSAMSIVVKWSPISATAELLLTNISLYLGNGEVTCRISQFPMTFTDLQGRSSVASISTAICPTVVAQQ